MLQHGQSHQLQHAHTDATYYEGVERLPGGANDSSAPAETSGQSHIVEFDGAGLTAGSVLTMASSAGSDWKVTALLALIAVQINIHQPSFSVVRSKQRAFPKNPLCEWDQHACLQISLLGIILFSSQKVDVHR